MLLGECLEFLGHCLAQVVQFRGVVLHILELPLLCVDLDGLPVADADHTEYDKSQHET